MEKNKTITFVSIFYDNENSKNAIIRQIKSFKYFTSNFNIEFIIVYNELNELNTKLKSLIVNNKPDNINTIRFFNRNDIYKKNNCDVPKFWKNDYGYYHQEIIKLLVCKFVTTEYYIQLDDTKFFINKCNDNMFFVDNNPKLFYGSLSLNLDNDYMYQYFLKSLKELDVNLKNLDKELKDIHLCSLVPFIFKTAYVNELISFLIQKHGKTLKRFFYDISYYKYTEFTIYQAFIIKKKYIKKYSLYPYYNDNYHIWNLEGKLNSLDWLKKYNMIGFKFKAIEIIQKGNSEEFKKLSKYII